MIIDEQTRIVVNILRTTDIDGVVNLLVEKLPNIATELSDKIGWKIQDNELTKGNNNAS